MQSSFSLLATVLVVLAASAAHAQCAFNAPAKARGIKADMVRAYSACPRIPCPGVSCFPPNTTTMAGVPACGPPVSVSSYKFGPRGACKFQMSQKAERPCAGGCTFDCANISFKASCKEVRDAAGLAIEAGAWAFDTVLRVTMDEPSGGLMTVIDIPLQFAFDLPKRGKLKMRVSTNDLNFDGVCIAQFLPPCAHTELISGAIVDPDGNVFATMGSSTG